MKQKIVFLKLFGGNKVGVKFGKSVSLYRRYNQFEWDWLNNTKL